MTRVDTPPETPIAKRAAFPQARSLLSRVEAAEAIERDPYGRWRVDFPTAVTLLEAWDKPWATRLQKFARTRLLVVYNAGFDVLEVGEP